MKRSKLLWSLVGIFIIVLVLWIYSSKYPFTIYEYPQTGRLFEDLGKLGGWNAGAVPIFIPDNPLWVDIIRGIAPITNFILILVILYILFGRKKGTSSPG